MPLDYRFKFPLRNGLHARPASHFEALTTRFRSRITLIHERTRVAANTRSVLSMVSADVKYEDPCRIEVDGEDERPALDAVRRFVRDELPHCDESQPEIPSEIAKLVLPRSLLAAGLPQYFHGRAVSGGVAIAKAVMIGAISLPANLEGEPAGDAGYERQRASDAILAVGAALEARIDASRQAQEVGVLKAHASIVRDVALSEAIDGLIVNKRRTAAQAIVEACRSFSETLRQSNSAYLRERILDVEDICVQLLDRVVHRDVNGSAPVLTGPSIGIAEHLTPGQLLGLNREHLKGLVLGEGGTTSHTVILARSMNLPTLVGVPHAMSVVRVGADVIVDGELGILVTEVTEPLRRYYAMEGQRLEHRRGQLDCFRKHDGCTADGHPVEIGANITSAIEAKIAFENGAQGIGLFRTEMLFMDRDSAPGEAEQAETYTAAAAAAHGRGGRPVIIRLLDIGGDKPAPYLKLPAEENPFLGYRGARLYGEFSALVKSQLRAILRASLAGNVKILVPMICCLEEVRQIKELIGECAAELSTEGVVIESLPPVGVMIEVPSLAFLMPELCSEVDFFSIGSNDLTQYFLATDRANQKVASLYTWSHPAFLRLLKSVVDQARAAGKWIGLCGEMGDQSAALPLLIGLGLDEISVSPPRVTGMKAAIGALEFAHCQKLLNSALSCRTRAEVEAQLANGSGERKGVPLLTPRLIITIDGATKHEVIKQIADRMYLDGRVVNPHLLEEAIWAREETYSTGFGFGFALPHCKTDYLAANSIVVARLTSPVDWGSLDNKPVDVVICLAIRASEHARQHMKIFANLSRLVMRDEFRDGIRGEADPVRLAAFLEQNLGPDVTASV